MSVSPSKLGYRNPPSTDTSPEKSIRKFKSHQQLSSATRNPHAKSGLHNRASREQLIPTAKTTDSLPSRTRANSDAITPFERPRSNRKPLGPLADAMNGLSMHARKSSLEMTLRDGPPPGTKPSESLSTLRYSILTSGVQATKEGLSDYRIFLWMTLLNVPPMPTDEYLRQIHRGRSPAYSKIANDVFRTLTSDALFRRRVTDASLTRLLNSTAWRISDAQKTIPSNAPTIQSTYIQGMNVLSAPFLYAARSEAQAYALLSVLLTKHIPTYITPTMTGVHAGLELMDKILNTIQPTLSQFLLSNSLPAKIYALPSVLTLCACTPPLPEVLRLWDFLFAFGTHLNVLCIVAQVILLKDRLLESPSPSKLLLPLPNLKAEEIIRTTLVIVRDLPEDIYAEVVRHGRV